MKVNVGTILKPDVREIKRNNYTLDDFRIGDIKRYYIAYSDKFVWTYGIIVDKFISEDYGCPCVKIGVVNEITTDIIVKNISEIVYFESVRFADNSIRDLFAKGKLVEVKEKLGILTQVEFLNLLNKGLRNNYKAHWIIDISSGLGTGIYIRTDKNNKIIITSKLNYFKPYNDNDTIGIAMFYKSIYYTLSDVKTILGTISYQ